MENSVMIALKKAQNAFVGEAERLEVKTEQAVVDMVKKVQQKKKIFLRLVCILQK